MNIGAGEQVSLESFNLLVSSARGDEHDANSELRYLLGELGDRHASTNYTPVSGLTVARTKLDPVLLISRLRTILKIRPWEFRYVLKVKPVTRVVPCTLEEITGAVVQQASMVKEGETFRVSLEKRQNHISSKDVIDSVASKVPRKVDLQNPSKLILIEIISQVAGVSVISPSSILGVEREKRASSSRASATLTVQ